MPRCNLKRILFLLFLVLFSLCLLLTCQPSSIWLSSRKASWIIPNIEKKFKNETFHNKPAIKLPFKNVLKINTKKNVDKKTIFQNSTFLCGKDGILTVKSGGRMGNLMGEYATLWALAKRDGIFPVVQHRTYNTLHKYFLRPSIPNVVDLDCTLKWKPMNLHVYNKLNKKERFQMARDGIFIDGYPTSVSLFHRHRSQIVKEFQFQDKFIERAQAELRRLRGNRQHVTFVGVHVRRTDYSQFLQGRFQAQLVGESYFTNAMNYFRKKYPSRLFVVTSDDMDWCRNHLKPVDDDIVYAGNRDTESPAEDMALLVACNHTVISYGNFGFWSAYLSGGEVILAGNISRTPTELQHSIRSANISGWQFFPGF